MMDDKKFMLIRLEGGEVTEEIIDPGFLLAIRLFDDDDEHIDIVFNNKDKTVEVRSGLRLSVMPESANVIIVKSMPHS